MSDVTKGTEASTIWAMLDRLYQKRDAILESSNRIVRAADELDRISASETFKQAQSKKYDMTELKGIFSSVQIDMNTIISCSHELLPHIKNTSLVSTLSNFALSILAKMNLPNGALLIGLGVISLELRVFAQSCNRLVLNPTRKSFIAAFGVNLGNEIAGIKAYIESRESNL
jgi:NurA-like 5'-3' nuclease